jgi:sulfate adenylyltransferase subunit 1
MELLRLITAGSVDDGKSTLIGRLLFDSKALLQDQLTNLENSSRKKGLSYLDFSLITDGLKDELQQGITIDIAHRYFTTGNRKYILADTPGHVQYTRNFVTAASMANLAIILIDARKGVVEQTRRHTLIASLMGIKHLVFCINKMDLVAYSQEVFNNIKLDIEELSSKLEVYDIRYIPVSALQGDNIVTQSQNMPWYTGWGLMETLENIHISSDRNLTDGRFPVQGVIRVNNADFPDYRACIGQIASGIFRPGDEVAIMPVGIECRIAAIEFAGKSIAEAKPPMSVSIILDKDIDVSRGNMIVKKNNRPALYTEVDAIICCLDEKKELESGSKLLLQNSHTETKTRLDQILYKINVNTFSRDSNLGSSLKMNDIARVRIKLANELLFDSYKINRATGSFILVDEVTYNTVAAGVIYAVNT